MRFPGFEGEWRKYKVAQIFRRIQIPVDVEAAKSYIQVGIRSHGKGLFYKEPVLGEELGNKRVFWIEPNCFIVNIVFAWERAVAKTTINENGLIASHRFPMYKPISGIVDLNYITIYFITRYGQKILELASPGGAGRNRTLGQNEFLNSFIVIPKIKEQRKIAEFIQLIDKKIEIQQSLLESLKLYKRGLFAKIFPQKGESVPRYRFEGFTDDWEQRKLGEVFLEYSEKNHPELPALTIIQGGGTVLRDESERNLQYNKSSLSGYKMVCENDFIVHLRSFEGGLEISNHKGLISPAYHTFRGDNVDSRFYYSYFRSYEFIKHKLVSHVYGIRDGRSIDIDGMKTIEIPYTSYEEQKKIGDYIENLDHLITIHQEKYYSYEKIKSALLQQLFI